jgi:hypothetical protein
VKSITESLSHELRSRPQAANVMAHLFMCVHSVLSVVKHPVLNVEFVSIGWMWSGLTAGEANQDNLEKLAGAWTALETVQFMLDWVRRGDF